MALAPDHVELGRINRSALLDIQIRWNGSLEWFEQPQLLGRLKQQKQEQTVLGKRARLYPQMNSRCLSRG
jgi:hypothetical protein